MTPAMHARWFLHMSLLLSFFLQSRGLLPTSLSLFLPGFPTAAGGARLTSQNDQCGPREETVP